MTPQALVDPKCRAERTFGDVRLHDLRRTRRAVQAATHLAENPLGSLPAQMQGWKATKALYRLRSVPDVIFTALMPPHCHQTRAQATAAPVTLLVQDTTDMDWSHRRQISGVGPMGNEGGRGFFLQTVLAVPPATGAVLGCIAQAPFVRLPAPEGEGRSQRRKREQRETDIRMRQVQAIGTPPPGSTWIQVGDRGADLFPFFQACCLTQTHLLVRAAQNRRVQGHDAAIGYSLTQARSWPSQASRPFEMPARHGRKGRSTHLQLARGPMTLLPPRQEPRAGKEPWAVWVIRVWEEAAPEGKEPLEWLRLASVPTTTLEHAWERVDGCRQHWLVEDYHHWLKSGCRIEERPVQTGDGLMRLLTAVVPACCALVADTSCRTCRPRASGSAGDGAVAPGRGGPALWSLACHHNAGHLLDGGGTPGWLPGTHA